ncbi:hypothetical protein [Lentzea kentuckyensis]|uniref:hypothetical protein n=1 Tax=Lentzea kentuckyensis TaxID=360086 RepID=UPI000A384ED0|nr:hypothetical protein [Lentzea kentuckyensis]
MSWPPEVPYFERRTVRFDDAEQDETARVVAGTFVPDRSRKFDGGVIEVGASSFKDLDLFCTDDGMWILYSPRGGVTPASYNRISDEAAREWLLGKGFVDAVAEFFG